MKKPLHVLSMGTVAIDQQILVDSLPKKDSFSIAMEENLIPGGSAANVSVALRQLGAQAYQSGQIGDDEFGRLFREDLKSNDVNDDFLFTKEDGVTLHNYIFVSPSGEHGIVANLGNAVNTLEAEKYPDNVLENMDIVYLDLFSPKAALFLSRKAKEKNIPVIFNLQCPLSLMENIGISTDEFNELLSLTDLFICGQAGADNFFREDNIKASVESLYAKYKNKNNLLSGWIFTNGTEGSYWYDGSSFIYHPIYEVESVDTTGAGDAYIAGIIYGYFHLGYSKEKAMALASAAAAMKVSQDGPRLQTNLNTLLERI